MRESFWGYWIIILGVFVIVIMMLISNVTTTNTQDYYLIKEVAEQSMVDAVDLGYYRSSGELRINADKFVESFLRRFSENVALSTYTIGFYGIYEAPPKVSIKVTTKSSSYNIGASSDSFDIINKVDAILEVDGTSVGGGPQPGTIDGSFTSNTGSSSDWNEDGTFNVSSSMIKNIVNSDPEAFYNMNENGTGTKKNKTEFSQIALNKVTDKKGSSLNSLELADFESAINSFYPTLSNDFSSVDFSDDDNRAPVGGSGYRGYFDADGGIVPSDKMMDDIIREALSRDYRNVDYFYNETREYGDNEMWYIYTIKPFEEFLRYMEDEIGSIKAQYGTDSGNLTQFEKAQIEDVALNYYKNNCLSNNGVCKSRFEVHERY